jgi:hypothetical protein
MPNIAVLFLMCDQYFRGLISLECGSQLATALGRRSLLRQRQTLQAVRAHARTAGELDSASTSSDQPESV